MKSEAFKNSWDLIALRKNGMRLESAAEIGGDGLIHKLGKHSY